MSTASTNFITSHDGFTLMDLVSNKDKHNVVKGEASQDGPTLLIAAGFIVVFRYGG